MPKITALTADTTPTSDDLTVIVNDPSGTPQTRKSTLANVITKAHGLTDGIVQVGSGTMNTTVTLDTDGTLAANSDTRIASQKATKTYTDNILGNANALVYKGVIDCSSNPNYPAADAGWLYVVSVAGKIGGASGIDVEVGDMAICNTDGTASGNQATVGSFWNIIQKNIIGAVTGPATAVTDNIAVFDGTTGKVIKDGGAKTSDFITKALIDAKGDLIVGSADNTPSILTSSGVNGNVLTVDTTTATGLKWATAASGGQTLYDIIVAPSGGDYTTLTAALAAATAGQTIFIRSGTYTETRLFSSALTTANLTIIGEDRASTILQFASTYGLQLSGAKVVLQNLRFEMGASGSYVWLQGANSYVSNCEFILGNTAAVASYQFSVSGLYTIVENSVFETTSTTNTQVQRIINLSNSRGTVKNNNFKLTAVSTSTEGTITLGDTNITFSNNYVYSTNTSNTTGNMLASASADQTIDSNYFRGAEATTRRYTAIYSIGIDFIINNNKFILCNNTIDLNGADRGVIYGNQFNDCNYAINSQGAQSDGIEISNNIINSTCSYGLYIRTQDSIISNNNITTQTGIGISNSGTGANNTYIGNYIVAPTNQYGIDSSTNNTNFIGNVLKNCGTAIRNTNDYGYISANRIFACNTYGIQNSGQNTLITLNKIDTIDNSTNNPIYVTGAGSTVANNFIADDSDIFTNNANISLYDNMYINGQSSTLKYTGTLNNENKIIFMKNTSGGALAAGDLVVLKATSGSMSEVTTTTTVGDPNVFGMALEAINNNANGSILVRGKTAVLKADATVAIAIGDYLTAYSTATRVAKATTGNTAIAIALTALASGTGTVTALIIPPRTI